MLIFFFCVLCFYTWAAYDPPDANCPFGSEICNNHIPNTITIVVLVLFWCSVFILLCSNNYYYFIAILKYNEQIVLPYEQAQQTWKKHFNHNKKKKSQVALCMSLLGVLSFLLFLHRGCEGDHCSSLGLAGAEEHLCISIKWRTLHWGPHWRVVDCPRWRHAHAPSLSSAPSQGIVDGVIRSVLQQMFYYWW